MVSISPVPKVLPAPVSYFHADVFTPVLAAPVKSSLHVSVKPAGGAPTVAATCRGVPTSPTTQPARPTTKVSASLRIRRIVSRCMIGSFLRCIIHGHQHHTLSSYHIYMHVSIRGTN